jgi:hypothetical protein
MLMLLSNTDAAASATRLSNSTSVLYPVIWLAEAIKQVLPETVQWCFCEVKFCMRDLTEKETNEKNVQDLQVYEV